MLIEEFIEKNRSWLLIGEAKEIRSLGHETMKELWADPRWMDRQRVRLACLTGVISSSEQKAFAAFCEPSRSWESLLDEAGGCAYDAASNAAYHEFWKKRYPCQDIAKNQARWLYDNVRPVFS